MKQPSNAETIINKYVHRRDVSLLQGLMADNIVTPQSLASRLSSDTLTPSTAASVFSVLPPKLRPPLIDRASIFLNACRRVKVGALTLGLLQDLNSQNSDELASNEWLELYVNIADDMQIIYDDLANRK